MPEYYRISAGYSSVGKPHMAHCEKDPSVPPIRCIPKGVGERGRLWQQHCRQKRHQSAASDLHLTLLTSNVSSQTNMAIEPAI